MRRPVRMCFPAAAALVVAVAVSGCGGGSNTTTTAQSSAPTRPTLAQFAGDPSCSFYNSAASIRMRIRAADIDLVCGFLARRFPVSRASWTTKPHHFRTGGGNHRYATICRVARSERGAWAEVEINAPTGRFTLGHLLCAGFVAKGWSDLGTRLTAFDALGLERGRNKELVLVYFCNTAAMSSCSPSATRGQERQARSRLLQERCVDQIVFVPKALAKWWVQKEEGFPPINLGANPLPDSLVIVAKRPSCAAHIAGAARAAHLPGVQAVRARS